MSKTLQWIGGIAAVIAVAIGAFFWFFEWNWLRSPAERFASSASGRGLTIGDIQGEWSLTPRFVFKDIRFGNAAWSKDEDMLAAETLEVVIDLRELLRGRLVLPQVLLDKPKLALERQADGQSNWTFGAELAKDLALPEDRSEMPLIGRMTIKEGTVKYRDVPLGLNLDGRIQTASAEGGTGSSRVEVQGQGTLQGAPFQLRLSGDSLLSLRENSEPYALTIDMTAAKTKARLTGTLTDPIKFEGLDLDLALQGPNLEDLSKITGVPLPITPPYDLKAKLRRDGDKWRFENIAGVVGRSDIAGVLLVDTGRERLYLEADLRSKVLDYRDVGFLIGIPPDQLDGAKTPSRVPAIERRVLPDAPLNIKQVREVDAKVRLRGDKVAVPDVPMTDVNMTLDLKNGVLKFAPLDVGVAGGRTIANITIDARNPRIRTDYDLRLRGYQLDRFLQAAGFPNAGTGRIDGRIRLVGYGDSVRKSLASANGDVKLVVNGAVGGAIGLRAITLAGGSNTAGVTSTISGATNAFTFNLGTNTLNIGGALTIANLATTGVINTTIASPTLFGNIRPVGATNLGSTLAIRVTVPATALLTVGNQFNIVQTQTGTVQSGTDGSVLVVTVVNPTNPLYTFVPVPLAGTQAGLVTIRLTGIPLLVPIAPPPGVVVPPVPALPIAVVVVPPLLALPQTPDVVAVLAPINAIADPAAVIAAVAQLAPSTPNLATPLVAFRGTRQFQGLWLSRLDDIFCSQVSQELERERAGGISQSAAGAAATTAAAGG